jgi:spermidine/putrescine-binding protein
MRKFIMIAAIAACVALLTAPTFAMSKRPEAAPALSNGEVLRINCWAGYAAPYVDEFQALVKVTIHHPG